MTGCVKSVTNCKLTTMYTLYGSYHLALSLQSTSKKTKQNKNKRFVVQQWYKRDNTL